ncbi:MAG: hypothetical protein K5793_08965 [Nitrosarchaeum sp.]|nr:hypothetical protein [Nitrosarchaeum sp.]
MNDENRIPRKDEIRSCIQLSKDTKAKLDKLGTRKDTYESIILSLIESPCVKKDDSENEEESE